MGIKPAKSIDEWGGLQPFLDGTRAKHNGLGYRAFMRRVDPNRNHKPSKSSIAEDFGLKNPRQIYRWIKRLQEEQAAADQSKQQRGL